MPRKALLRIPFDIWDQILCLKHIKTFNDASDLLTIQTICWDTASLVQPYLYRHVNLLDLDAFTSFSEAVAKGRLDPAQCVRTLQISFNTEGLSTKFFEHMSTTLFALKHLHCLLLCYSHHDLKFVFNLRNLATYFPPSLKELHIKPILEECWRNCPGMENKLARFSYGPWRRKAWANTLANLKNVELLVYTTPTDLIYPPDEHRTEQVKTSWTKELNAQSPMRRIVLYFGYGQEKYPNPKPVGQPPGEDDSYESYNDLGTLAPHMDFGYDNGIRLCWKSNGVGNWFAGYFDHNGINFAMFAFDNTDHNEWPYLPADENHRETKALVRGTGCQFPGDQREFIYGYD